MITHGKYEYKKERGKGDERKGGRKKEEKDDESLAAMD